MRLSSSIAKSQYDGLLVVGAFLSREIARQLLSTNCPVVLVDGYSEVNRFDRVLMINFDGAYRAVSFLIEKGHQHIGLVGSSSSCYPSIMERREGYLRALVDHGISPSYITDSLLNRDTAHVVTHDLLTQYPQVTGVFVVNDNAAMGVMSAAREMGRDIPEQISIIGFDDIAFSQDLVPPLTTMHVDKMEMGKLALRQLLYRIENKESPLVTLLMDVNLVPRKSVKTLK